MNNLSQFLQSNKWADFQASLGFKIIKSGDNFFIKKPLFLNKYYLYCPRCKNIDFSASDKKALFLRFEPLDKVNNDNVIKTINIQPAKTLILDLTKSEDDLLKDMHQKTRYNIRLAEKKGVKIIEDKNKINDFLKLMQVTTERDKFSAHENDYYQALANFDPGFIKLFLAEYEGRIIAAGLFCFYDNCVTYLHGASSNADRNIMAPYLLQWLVIKLAKESGYKYYDFYGIDEVKWPGVTRFKTGFGGEVINYPGTYDYIINKPWYFIYQILRKIRRAL